jgi:hypothetical protein
MEDQQYGNQIVVELLQQVLLKLDAMQAELAEQGERLSKAEVSIKHGIDGNGQPSQLAMQDERLRSLENWRWKLVGAWSAITIISTVLVKLFWK